MHTGIDLGLNITAIVTFNDYSELIYQDSFGIKKSKRYADTSKPATRYRIFYDRFCNYFERYKITGTVVMEKPMNKIMGHPIKLMELNGFYLVALAKYIKEEKIFQPSPIETKKFFTGSEGAIKLEMVEECKERGFYPDSHSQADAIAMALMSVEGYYR